MTNDQEFDLFFGRLSTTKATVYVRVPGVPGGGDWAIEGAVRGPMGLSTSTLPATSELRDLGDGDCLLGAAVIPDPCFWSPDRPLVYQVSFAVSRGNNRVSVADQIGLRWLGVDGVDLVLEGRRWVLRGTWLDDPTVEALDDYRASSLAAIVAAPPEDLCSAASACGVFLIAWLKDVPRAAVHGELARLGRWPAVAAAVLPSSFDEPMSAFPRAPNLLLAQHLDEGRGAVADWAQLVVAEATLPEHVASIRASCGLPVIAHRREPQSPHADARAACDRLQRDLVRIDDFAGYLV